MNGRGPYGVTLKVTTFFDKPMKAVMFTSVTFLTALVVMLNVATVPPPFTVTLAGTDATLELLLDRETTVPEDGATLVVTVANTDCPPFTLVALNVRAVTVGGGSTVSVALAER